MTALVMSGEVMSRPVVLTDHAQGEARRRGIRIDTVLDIAIAPEQRIASRGREIRQSRVADADTGKLSLVRVVVEPGPDADTIVTVYRTSRIRKYWRDQ